VRTSRLATRHRVAGLVLALLLVRGLALAHDEPVAPMPVAPEAPPEDTRPAPLREVAIDQRLDAAVPLDLPFRDESGAPVTLAQYFGKRPVILSLVYYDCPMLCTLVLNGLVRALRTLSFDPGREFEIVTVSFDPHDTPELATKKKATYLGEYARPGAEQGWHFLTGDQDAITRLAQAVGFHYSYVPEEKQFAHAAAIMVLTPDGRLSRYFFGVEYSGRDLRFGLIDAAERKIGTVVDHLLLYCYRYDPATGRYGAVAMNLVRAGGVLTVVALGAFILIMRRRETQGPPLRPRPPDLRPVRKS
jgi:protein SCO1/2